MYSEYNIKIKRNKCDINKNYLDIYSDIQKTILCNRANDEQLKHLLEDKINIDTELDKLTDIHKAALLIKNHILDDTSAIVLTFDKDTDGITSGAVLYKTMVEVLSIDVSRVIPIISKRRDGNGLNKEVIRKIKEIHGKRKVGVIITADYGSSDQQNILTIQHMGIDIVITDHHHIPVDNYPSAATVFINNQRKDSIFNKEASGCLIAFMLMLAVDKSLHGKLDFTKFFSLTPFVAISLVADVMSFNNLFNRYIYNIGMNELNSNRHNVWRAINKILSIINTVSVNDIGFKISPLINTANRTDSEDEAFNMLKSVDYDISHHHGKNLANLTVVRKKEQKRLLDISNDQIDLDKYKNSITLYFDSGMAVNGIIAGNVGQQYNRPVVCFIGSVDSNTISGSARAIVRNVDILKVFNYIESVDNEVFIKYGGHVKAAGCSIHKHKLDDFKRLFDEAVSLHIGDESIDDIRYIDSILTGKDISPSIIREIDTLAPYGKGWEYPTFASKCKVISIKVFGPICKLILDIDGNIVDGIYFFGSNSRYSKNDILDNIRYNDRVIIIYQLFMNTHSGIISLQLTINDIIKE